MKSMENNNGKQSAYPVHGGYHNDDPRNQIIGGGLTKREYFAAMALQGILSNPNHNNMDLMGVNTQGPFGFIAANFAAKEAIQYADELLKQL